MGREIAEAVPEAMEVYETGSEAAGIDLKRALLQRPGRSDARHQGAAAGARRDEPRDQRRRSASRGIEPDYVVGHSVGEFAALGAAESIGIADAIALVRERGLAMAEAARQHPGSMAAILGLADEVVEGLCKKIHNVWPANYNCPGQIVISGEDDAVGRVLQRGGAGGCATRGSAARLGRVPLAARRPRRRSAAAGGREDPLLGPALGVHVDRDREARGRAAATESCSSSS